MRVAFVGPFGLKPKGTMAVRALPLAKALTQRGHTVAMFLPPWSYPEDAGRVFDEEGVHIENVTVMPRVQIPLRLVSSVRAFQPDVVHVFKPKAYAGLTQWFLWQMRRVGMSKARIVLDEDDWEGAGGWNDLEPYSWTQKKFFARQEQWGLTHADAVTVAARALETIVWSLGVPRARVVYLPNGVNHLPASSETREMVRHALGLEDAPVILLYTRFFEYALTRLVQVLTRVFAQMPNAKLLVAGKGLFGEEKKFIELAEARGWRERVVDAGWVDMTRLRAFFAASDLAVYPFDDTLINRTKAIVKLMDLLSCGVPVVAEAVGQIKEYIRHNESGMLVPLGDVDTFVSSVLELLNHPGKRARLGACAMETMSREYDWCKLAECAERAYRNPI